MGGVGAVASILITGLLSTDSLSCTTPSSTTIYPTWNGSGWLFSNLKAYGNYVVTAGRTGKTSISTTVNVDTATDYTIPMTFSRLPSGFQEVEWIGRETNNTQYIDLGVTFTTSHNLNIKFYINSYVNDAQILGSTNGTSVFYLDTYNNYWWVKTTTSENDFKSGVSSGSHEITILNGTSLTLDNVAYLSGKSYQTTTDLWIFRRGNNYAFLGKIYGFTLTNKSDGSYVRNLVPCYCTESKTGYKGSTSVTVSSGTIGLYDLAGGRFYVNAGSGTFTKGDDV